MTNSKKTKAQLIAELEEARQKIAKLTAKTSASEKSLSRPENEEDVFSSVFEKHAAAMLLIDPHSGMIVDANPAAVSFYGYSREIFPSLHIGDINMLPREELSLKYRKALNLEENFFTFPHRTSNGQRRWVEVHSTPMTYRGKNLLLSIIHDATERIESEQALRQSEAIRQAVLDSRLSFIMVKNHEGRFVLVNNAFAQSMGVAADSLLGKTDFDIFPREMAERFRKEDMEILETQKPLITEDKVTLDGQERYFLGIRTPFGDERAGTSGVCVITTDITDRKQLEAALSERVKELEGLYALSRLVEEESDIARFIERLVNEVIPPSMQYPEHVIAAVSINDKVYSNSDHSASVSLSATIDFDSKTKGFIKVGYDKDLPFISDLEQRLVNTYADIIGRHLSRIKTRKKLKESEERYKALYDSVLDPILVAEIDTGIIIECNSAAEELFGRSRSELIGLHQGAFHPPDDITQEGVTRHFKKHLEEPELTQEVRLLRPDGSFRVADVKAKRFSLQGKDLILGVFHDTTEAKKSEQALRRSEEHHRLLTENVRDIIWQRDADLNVTYMSPSVETVLGFTPEEAMAASPEQRFTPASLKLLAELREELQVIITKGGADTAQRRLELEALHKDGHSVWLEIDARSVTDEEGRFLYLMGVSRDITERKQAEVALRESEGRVRRKLKAILNPEEGMAELELSDIIDSEALQSMMDNFYQVTGIGIGVLDMKGNVLVATGWQDICTRFHRVHPDTAKSCRRSDLQLSSGVPPGEFRLYRCKNNMWDIASPLMVGDKHMGNIFLGQFFFEDEEPDREAFRRQAQLYGFDEKDYLEALDRVPRWSREKVDTVMRFYSQFAESLASLSYGNIKLAWAKTEQDRLYDEVRLNQDRLSLAVEMANMGHWEMDIPTMSFTFNEQFYSIYATTSKLEGGFVMSADDYASNFVHPDEANLVSKEISKILSGEYDDQIAQIEHRIIRRDGVIRHIVVRYLVIKDSTGERIKGSSTRRVEFDFIDYNSDCAIAQDLQEEVTAYECK